MLVTGEAVVILDDKSMRWELEVLELALRSGWTAYGQTLRNRRQHAPSTVLVCPTRVLLVYLRLNRRNPPPVEQVAEHLGIEAVLWTPADRPQIRHTLAELRP